MTAIFLCINLGNMINEHDLQNYKEQLEKEAGELEIKIKALKKMPEFGNDVESDFSEEADEAEQYSANLGEKDAYKERLADIEHAIEKTVSGGYGKCEKCGKEISADVLKASPESRLCKDCKIKKQ